jgi:hypothetical protein
MRHFRSSLTVIAAALYVLLGISASWHGSHFMRGDLTIGEDAHAAHESHLDSESCALCSTKQSAQEASASASDIISTITVGDVVRAESAVPVGSLCGVARARAPPVLS